MKKSPPSSYLRKGSKRGKSMFDEKKHEPGKEHEQGKPGQQPPPGQKPGQPGGPGQGGQQQPGGGKLVEEAGSPPKEEKEGDGGSKGEGGEEEEPAPLGKSSDSVEELEKKMLGGSEKIKQAVEGQAEQLVEIITLKGSSFTHRGRCKKCGWQSFQMDEGAAKDMVKQHALSHWRELMAEKLGQAAGMQEPHQPQGQPLPGQQTKKQGPPQ